MEFFSIENLFTLAMLTLLQAVLGFDNLLYISLESQRAPAHRQAMVRRLGIGLAMVLRIVLLFLLVNVIEMFQSPWFEIRWTGVVEGVFNFHAVIVLFGVAGIATAFGWLAILVMAIFLLRLRYLLAAGFSPMWGALTFPVAAFANLMLLLAIVGEPFRILGGLSLIAATLILPYIAYRILRLWAEGKLGPMTNAARI